jgi:DNA-binding HxlR family transcriptional regulator
MDKPLLDEQCKKILSVFLVSQKTLRFNEMHRIFNDIGLKMTKPTLVDHLNHLREKKLIIRKEEGKQCVSYAANWTKLKTHKQSLKTREFVQHHFQNKELFNSFSIKEQVTWVTNLLTLRTLYKLKLEIEDAINPRKSFEHSIQFLLTDRFFEIFKIWLLENCHSSKTEKGPKALSMIDHCIDIFTCDLFDVIPRQHDQEAKK